MGNNLTDRVTTPIGTVTGPLLGANLIDQLKTLLLTQNVFKTMFGSSGERIFTDQPPNYNETIMPLLELWWGSERYENFDVYQTGTIRGRIILPTQIKGNFNFFRSVAASFMRFIGSDIFDPYSSCPGLRKVGAGTEFRYDQIIQIGGLDFPLIEMTIPFEYDLELFRLESPDTPVQGNLDDPLIGLVETYILNQSVEDASNTITITETVSTGQING